MKKYVCIHGHFYQPPRENPWLEYIEAQESARPFHDWNERINFECYAPNRAARILNGDGAIRSIVNNYTHISFNFGPTLLSWIERHDQETYHAILEADRTSQSLFGGHGNAIAQAFNHTILPLDDPRDREIQILWGIRDFEARFGRKPEGMWLPETAVNTDTLKLLAAHGIRFTILAPRQAKAVKPAGHTSWQPVNEQTLDTSRAYRYHIPGTGQSIALFFYDGTIAREVAFEGLLHDGDKLADRLIGSLRGAGPQLAHIATDGESYGHHHKYGEMALARAISIIRTREDIHLTNYGQFLEQHPPEDEVQIHENSSWSCAHGVERWRADCGCHTGSHPDWHQRWRAPLRQALDRLRDRFYEIAEQKGKAYFKDLRQARIAYYDVIRDRSDTKVEHFLKNHYIGSSKDIPQALRLMEMLRYSMYMYTSCGWFFDEVSGIETSQILQYAGRAIQYAEHLTGTSLQNSFIKSLTKVPSNIFAHSAAHYTRYLMPNVIGFERVAMHYAALSLFRRPEPSMSLFVYRAHSEHFESMEGGLHKMCLGHVRLESTIIRQARHFTFAVIYLGQQNIIGGLAEAMPEKDYRQMRTDLTQAFGHPDLGRVFSLMNTYFEGARFSIWELFVDERQRILNEMLQESMDRSAKHLEEIYRDNYQLMAALHHADMHIPDAFLAAAEFVINRRLDNFLNEPKPDARRLEQIVEEKARWNLRLTNPEKLNLQAGELVFREVKKITLSHASSVQMRNLLRITALIEQLGLRPNLWKSQNLFYRMIQGLRKRHWDYHSIEWQQAFLQLGQYLRMEV